MVYNLTVLTHFGAAIWDSVDKKKLPAHVFCKNITHLEGVSLTTSPETNMLFGIDKQQKFCKAASNAQ